MAQRKRKPEGTMANVDKLLSYAIDQFSLSQSRIRAITLRASAGGAAGKVVTVDADSVATAYRLWIDEHGECRLGVEANDDQ